MVLHHWQPAGNAQSCSNWSAASKTGVGELVFAVEPQRSIEE
jgi:hypothetical protein